MMERAADAWEHNQFKDVIVKVANVELYVSLPFSEFKASMLILIQFQILSR